MIDEDDSDDFAVDSAEEYIRLPFSREMNRKDFKRSDVKQLVAKKAKESKQIKPQGITQSLAVERLIYKYDLIGGTSSL